MYSYESYWERDGVELDEGDVLEERKRRDRIWRRDSIGTAFYLEEGLIATSFHRMPPANLWMMECRIAQT